MHLIWKIFTDGAKNIDLFEPFDYFAKCESGGAKIILN